MKELKISVENATATYDNADANGESCWSRCLFNGQVFAQDIKDQ